MNRPIVIEDARGRRTLSDADLPLRIGAGAGADIRLAGSDAGATFAYVGLSEARLFVQPADDTVEVFHNGRLLTESRFLENGDVLRVADGEVRFAGRGSHVAFLVAGAAAPTPPRASRAPRTPATHSPETLRSPAPVRASHPGRRRVLTAVALLVFAMLTLAAGFVFMATPVSIEVTPRPDAFGIDGALPAVEVGGRWLLLPGEYRVRAAKDGYRALDERLRIEASAEQAFELALEKLPGVVTFVVHPEVEADVRMDGAALGTTPLEDVEIPPGEHAFVVTADRYAPRSVNVEVRGGGEPQTVDVTLEPLWAVVSIASEPAGARVFLDASDIGETPLEAEILEGTYTLSLRREGFDTLTETLEVVANQPQTLPVYRLVESNALLAIESTPSGATVTVAGEFRGRTPLELSLAPRTMHTIKLSKSGHASSERQVELEPASSEKLNVSLAPRYATVLITSIPVDATLYVDGKRHGPATGRVELTTRPHTLTIKKSGYRDFSTTLTPRAGVVQSLSVELMTTAQAKAAARKPLVTTAEGQTLKLLEPSRFRMGASRREPGRRANESLRTVEITRAYYLGIKEVSNAEYRRFAPDHASGTLRGKTLDGATQPVARVTWEDAVRYLNWLSARDSLPPYYRAEGESFVAVTPPTIGYRLPTEAEWAFAARYAGSPQASKYPWGGAFPPSGSAGNYADTAARSLLANTLSSYADGFAVSAPVGSFAPNAAGFFDLGGNVAEWCQDYYAVYPNAAGTLVTDPAGPDSGRHRVVRGSSWRHAGISELRLSYRDYSEKARIDLGFRIARYAE